MDWIEANGVSLRYDFMGEGDETLILIHEMSGSLESWDEVLPELQRHFRVLRYDQRGSGLSEKTNQRNMEDSVGDLYGLLTELEIKGPCAICAPTFGAAIALVFAARYPEMVSRMLLSSPSTIGNKGSQTAREERIKKIEREGMRPSAERSLKKTYPEVLRDNFDRFERYRLRWISNDPEGFNAVNRFMPQLDVTAEMRQIACPTLVIGGSYDLVRTVEMSQAVAESIPSAVFVEAKTGHVMPVQTPELFLEHAVPFLTAC